MLEACDCFINNCRVHTTFSLRDFQAKILDFNIKINLCGCHENGLNKKILYINYLMKQNYKKKL